MRTGEKTVAKSSRMFSLKVGPQNIQTQAHAMCFSPNINVKI